MDNTCVPERPPVTSSLMAEARGSDRFRGHFLTADETGASFQSYQPVPRHCDALREGPWAPIFEEFTITPFYHMQQPQPANGALSNAMNGTYPAITAQYLPNCDQQSLGPDNTGQSQEVSGLVLY